MLFLYTSGLLLYSSTMLSIAFLIKLILSTVKQMSKEEEVDERAFFKLLEKAGSIGRYQNIMVVILSIVSYIDGGLMLMIPYLLYQDPYTCPTQSNEDQCYQDVCQLPIQERLQFVPSASISTLGNQFGDYRCPDVIVDVDMVSTLLFLGGVLGYIAITIFGGWTGRKNLMLISLALTFIGTLITLLCVNLLMAGIGLFIAAFGIQNGFNICFYFLAEAVSQTHREKYSVLIQLFFGLGVLANVGYFYVFGDWQIIVAIFYLIPIILALIGTFLLLEDTPLFLVTKNSAEKSWEKFKKISRMNKITDFTLEVKEIQKIQEDYQKLSKTEHKESFTVIDLFRYKSLRMMTILLTIINIIISFLFYAPALMIDEFEMDIYLSGAVVGFSQLIAYPICYFLINKSPRKKVALICFSICLVCSIGLWFVWGKSDPSELQNVMKLVLIFALRFFITFEYTVYILYFNELYPTQVRVLGTSLVCLFSMLFTSGAPMLIEYCKDVGFPIMILFIGSCIISFFCSIKLPETFMKPPTDVIQEFKHKKESYTVIIHTQDAISETISNTNISKNSREEKYQSKNNPEQSIKSSKFTSDSTKKESLLSDDQRQDYQ